MFDDLHAGCKSEDWGNSVGHSIINQSWRREFTALNVTLMLTSLSCCPVSFAARKRYLSLETAKKSLDKYAMHTYGWLACSLPIGDFLWVATGFWSPFSLCYRPMWIWGKRSCKKPRKGWKKSKLQRKYQKKVTAIFEILLPDLASIGLFIKMWI